MENNQFGMNYTQNSDNNNLLNITKAKAKNDSENSFDKILQAFQNAKNNGLKLEKDYENIGMIKRIMITERDMRYLNSLIDMENHISKSLGIHSLIILK